jgi:hypothetical protein
MGVYPTRSGSLEVAPAPPPEFVGDDIEMTRFLLLGSAVVVTGPGVHGAVNWSVWVTGGPLMRRRSEHAASVDLAVEVAWRWYADEQREIALEQETPGDRGRAIAAMLTRPQMIVRAFDVKDAARSSSKRVYAHALGGPNGPWSVGWPDPDRDESVKLEQVDAFPDAVALARRLAQFPMRARAS